MRSNPVKRVVDILLGIGLTLLMSFQVTGEAAHEWTGVAMTLLMVVHQALNWKWYASLFKGKYTPVRIARTAVNAALIPCFVLSALSGVSMSAHAVPFLGDFMRASLSRRLHLPLSHWCFVLMGLHLGLHMPAMLKGAKGHGVRRVGWCASIPAAGAGLWLFLLNRYPDYLFCRVPFAFIDYDRPAPLALLEALLIAFFWAFAGFQLSGLLNRGSGGRGKWIALLGILLAVAIGIGMTAALPAPTDSAWNGTAVPWSMEGRPETSVVAKGMTGWAEDTLYGLKAAPF